jgi:anti-sigma factor RsiW
VKRFFNPCGRQARNISLLAAGVLSEREKTQVQTHLQECAACRQRYEEIQSVTVPLANWAESLTPIEPDASAQRRWVGAVEMAGRKDPVRGFAPAIGSRIREVFWPWRRVWAGLATVLNELFADRLPVETAEPPKVFSPRPRTEKFQSEIV